MHVQNIEICMKSCVVAKCQGCVQYVFSEGIGNASEGMCVSLLFHQHVPETQRRLSATQPAWQDSERSKGWTNIHLFLLGQ